MVVMATEARLFTESGHSTNFCLEGSRNFREVLALPKLKNTSDMRAFLSDWPVCSDQLRRMQKYSMYNAKLLGGFAPALFLQQQDCLTVKY